MHRAVALSPGPGFGFEGFAGFAASAFASGAAFAEAAVGLFQLVAFVACERLWGPPDPVGWVITSWGEKHGSKETMACTFRCELFLLEMVFFGCFKHFKRYLIRHSSLFVFFFSYGHHDSWAPNDPSISWDMIHGQPWLGSAGICWDLLGSPTEAFVTKKNTTNHSVTVSQLR